MPDWKNKLFFGDNLPILREHIAAESVDLVYLDPPFNSNANYNVLFAEKSGEQSAAQIAAFTDTWHWGKESEETYYETIMKGGRLAEFLQAFRVLLGQSDMMAYLVMMAPRLQELHRVLNPTGSIYLHCDPTASHYLKLLMDAIFGAEFFRNEIVWKRSHAHSDSKQGAKHYGRVTDTLLFYSKGEEPKWHPQYVPYDQKYIDRDYRRVDQDGRRYRIDNLQGPGGAAKGNPQYEVMGVTRYWRYKKEKMEELIKQGRVIQTRPGAVPQYKRYLDEMPGVPVQSLWDDLPLINNRSNEGLGYPTQKPESLLERLIKTSSDEGDIVLDPFCGCGTSISVAERLHRKWIGVDITHLAITLIRHRLTNAFGAQLAPYEIIGAPTDLSGAKTLAEQDRYQFQWWALGLVDAKPEEKKKGADKGIDGVIPFIDDNSAKLKKAIIQVKSGGVKRADIATLKSDVDREHAQIGVFITLEPATKPMNEEATTAGFYEPLYGKHVPKIQILTIEDLLDGRKPELPHYSPIESFKKAPTQKKGSLPEQPSLL